LLAILVFISLATVDDPVTAQRLQPVSRNCRHVVQILGVVEQT
jgi:hypothetical protein